MLPYLPNNKSDEEHPAKGERKLGEKYHAGTTIEEIEVTSFGERSQAPELGKKKRDGKRDSKLERMIKHLNLVVSLTNASPCELLKAAEVTNSELLKKARSTCDRQQHLKDLLKINQDQHTGLALKHSTSNYLFMLEDSDKSPDD